jgi:hypothetical protein
LDGVKVKQSDKRPEYRVIAQGVITGAFGAVAVATKHEHWLKTPDEVEPIVGPLCRMIEELPPKTLKAFEKHFNLVALVGGAGILIGTDVIAEVKIRKEENATREEEKTGIRRATPIGKRSGNPVRTAPNGGEPIPPIGGERSPNGTSSDWGTSLPDADVITDYGLESS